MSKRGHRKCISFAGGGLLALLLSLFSVFGLQAAENEEAVILETLDVEAEEETERIILDLEQSFEEPFMRGKVFSEKIEQESIPDVKAAVKELANVTVREFGGFSSTIEIRGLSGDRIISIVDGVRLSNQGLTYRGGGEINMIDIGTVDSIEVIKGSPSVIYDPGATGGVLLVESKQIAAEDHLKLKYTFGYDEGREKTKNTFFFSGARRGFGAAFSYSETDADGYKVRDKEKLQEVIDRTNSAGDGLTGTDRLTDLGFQEQSLTLDLNYIIHENHSLTFKYSDFEVKDSTSIIPSARPTLFHVNFLSRESSQIRYQIKKLGVLQDIRVAYADQDQVREAAEDNTFILESQNMNASGVLSIQNTDLTFGGEFVFDEAETQVLADQDYWAGYLSAEHIRENFTYLAGIRVNQWDLESEANPSNINVRGLEGFLINPVSKEKTAYTYSNGIVYSVNENNNLSFNYSKTHRFPSLFERFINDGTFIGCDFSGLDCRSEEANNFDAAWKYYDGLFSMSLSIFYSDFDDYIATKQVRPNTSSNIQARADLEACIEGRRRDHPKESPEQGLSQCLRDDTLTSFQTVNQFFNIKRVVNQGFEVSLRRLRESDYEAGLSFGLNDFDVLEVREPSEKRLFSLDSNPLEFNFYYKRYFSDWPASPWIQFKGRYVTGVPKVEQEDGFSPFFVADLFAGFKYPLHHYFDLTFNAGIRNLGDKIYHEAFSVLDGLERSFFFNVSLELET